MLNFYDFEVFKNDWLVVIINPIDKTERVIVNNSEELKEYYEAHKSEIWVGYNSQHYDQFILKGILLDFDPKEINDYIIAKGQPGWKFSSLFRKLQLFNYDVMYRNDRGLKSLEGFMGNNIKETSVPFDIDRKLTDDEIAETIKYCRHDVQQTIEVFLERQSDFDAQMGLVKMFNLPLSNISKSKSQLSAMILDAHRPSISRNDEFDISFPNTLIINKYKDVIDWYKDENNHDYSKSLKIDVAGVETIFGWGGIHSAKPKYSGEGYYLNMDVASLYPSLMIVYNLHSRNISNPQKFVDIYNNRLKYKAEKNPLQLPLKTLLNSTYGAMKDKNNNLYDPLMANNICIHGQLLILDLIEKLEPVCEIIQSNTDGILIKMKRYEDFDLIDDIVYEWEQRTDLNMEFDEFKRVFQKDVNNYIMVPNGDLYDEKGKPRWKAKGAYVKKLNALDYDLPIVNEALVNFMIKGQSVEDTINGCDELKKFQKIVKVSGKYKHAIHNGEILSEKCFRVFASNRTTDGEIRKFKDESRNPEKFANTPEKCFVFNEDVKNVKTPKYLDRSWYINIAKERLNQFGVM